MQSLPKFYIKFTQILYKINKKKYVKFIKILRELIKILCEN